MVCGSGCCGPPQEQAVARDGPSPVASPQGKLDRDDPGVVDTCCAIEEDDSNVVFETKVDKCKTTDHGKDKDSRNTAIRQCCAASNDGSIDSAHAEDDCCTPKVKIDDCVNACCGSNNEHFAAISTQANSIAEPANESAKKLPSVGCQFEQDHPASESILESTNTSEFSQGFCAPKPKDCSAGCCGSARSKRPTNSPETTSIGAIAGKAISVTESDGDKAIKICSDDGEKGCCSSGPTPEVHGEKTPSCCEGKTSPCCDSTCIDRLALRECASRKASKLRQSYQGKLPCKEFIVSSC